MKILGIETTTEYFCIGAYDNGMIYEYGLQTGTKLSDIIDTSIKSVLFALGWAASEVDYYACGIGPGSFTGIRIGMAMIKGLSWAVNKPVVGVPSLDILALNSPYSGKVVTAIDARRRLVYCAAYELRDGELKKTRSYKLLCNEDFLRLLKGGPYVIGNAAGLYREDIIKKAPHALILDRDHWQPRPRNLMRLALDMIRKKEISNTFDIQPIYLYPKECQIRK